MKQLRSNCGRNERRNLEKSYINYIYYIYYISEGSYTIQKERKEINYIRFISVHICTVSISRRFLGLIE